MKLITQRTLIRSVVARWNGQYPPGDHIVTFSDGRSVKEIREKLAALDTETATHEEVSAIIGNDSWTRLDECGECREKASSLVLMGEDPYYDSVTVAVCPACLAKAIALTESP